MGEIQTCNKVAVIVRQLDSFDLDVDHHNLHQGEAPFSWGTLCVMSKIGSVLSPYTVDVQ